MKTLEIDCKGIGDVSFYSGSVTLEDVDMSFLEELDSYTIVYNHNNQKLLDAMDVDEIAEWYESKFDVTVVDHSREVE